MKTGSRGTFVISWSQCELDGSRDAPVSNLSVGAVWRWSGEAISVDGAREVLILDGAMGDDELRSRAARQVRRLLGDAAPPPAIYDPEGEDARLFDGAFDVTDGHARFTITLIDVAGSAAPLLMLIGGIPPKDTDLWVVSQQTAPTNRDFGQAAAGGVICFTPGTRIATEDGPKLVQHLHEGDRILTKDNGPQELVWIGGRILSGARLYAMPELRPVRLRASALGSGVPDGELVVSPQHRILLRGGAARALFNADEVLVTARDLVNDHAVIIDHSLREVQYIHLMLEQHQVVWANGVETESFHPGSAELDQLSPGQRHRLFQAVPPLEHHPDAYGAHARRMLNGGEAAILRHDAR